MPITDKPPYVAYNASGGDTYVFEFKVFAETDPAVTVGGTLQVLGSDYAVTIAADPAEGGSVVFQAGKIPDVGLVEIQRAVPVSRATDYQEAGGFRQAVVDGDFDRAVAMVQDAGYRIGLLQGLDLDARLAALETLFPPFGTGSDSVQMRSAAAGQVFVDIVAANDPAARIIVIGKTDATENPVTIRPAVGTISTSEGRSASCNLTMQDEAIRIAPDAANNNWVRVG